MLKFFHVDIDVMALCHIIKGLVCSPNSTQLSSLMICMRGDKLALSKLDSLTVSEVHFHGDMDGSEIKSLCVLPKDCS